MDRKFETTYSQDYTQRLENRQLALRHKTEANLPGSCFSPPIEVTVPVLSGDVKEKSIDFESQVKQNDFSQCGKNRFVKNLVNTHPELYANIEANRPWEQRAGLSQQKSTYQLDYDRLPECPPCPRTDVFESNRWPDLKYFQRECNGTSCNGSSDTPCYCQLCPQELDGQTKEQRNHGRVYAISSIPKSYIISSHWPEKDWERKTAERTEYRDKVGRLGRILQRGNIHDHSGCINAQNCHHHFFL